MTIRVAVADDQALVWAAFAALLAGEPGMQVAGTASGLWH
jgi:DNA-binding NarL/FixJ family response regulator